MYVPDGVGDAVTVAVLPEHTVGLFTVTVGGVVMVTVPLAELLAQLGVPVVDTTTEYEPAVEVVKLATLPGLVTPLGTVHT